MRFLHTTYSLINVLFQFHSMEYFTYQILTMDCLIYICKFFLFQLHYFLNGRIISFKHLQLIDKNIVIVIIGGDWNGY